jgi:hypothetical protein
MQHINNASCRLGGYKLLLQQVPALVSSACHVHVTNDPRASSDLLHKALLLFLFSANEQLACLHLLSQICENVSLILTAYATLLRWRLSALMALAATTYGATTLSLLLNYGLMRLR